jgi:hypothetical protein
MMPISAMMIAIVSSAATTAITVSTVLVICERQSAALSTLTSG